MKALAAGNSPFPCEDLVIVLSSEEIDKIAGATPKAEDFELAAMFRKHAGSIVDTEQATSWRTLADVLEMHFRPHNVSAPFEAMLRMENKRSMIPDDLIDNQLAFLEQVADSTVTPAIRARLSDVIWLRKKHAPRARDAIAAYLQLARQHEDPQNWVQSMEYAERAVRLARQLGKSDDSYISAINYLNELISKYRGDDPLFLSSKTMDLLLEFDEGDPETCLQAAQHAADRSNREGNFYRARVYLELIARWATKKKDSERRENALRAIVETFEREADQKEGSGDFFGASHFLLQAIEASRRIPGNKNAVNTLRAKLRSVEPKTIGQFQSVKTEINLTDVIEKVRTYISGQTKREAIRRLAFVQTLSDPEKTREEVIKRAQQFPLQNLFGAVIVDSQGRNIAKRPAFGISEDSGSNEEAIWSRMVEQMSLERGICVQAKIAPALAQLTFEHAILSRDIAEITQYSAFVPEDHQLIFVDGLLAGFEGDFIRAGHLLILQIENSIRHLMRHRSMVTTSLDSNGIQQELDLNALLVDPRMPQVITKPVIFELRSLLTDKRGPNLRNRLAHGMLADRAFSSAEVIYAWWIVLTLCGGLGVVDSTDEQTVNS